MTDLDRFDAVLLDLDGTLYAEETALPGAVEFVRKLQRERRRFACISNSTLSAARVVERLRGMGLSLDAGDIFTAAEATADYVRATFPPRPRVFNLATESIDELLDGQVDWVEAVGQRCDVVIAGAPANVHAGFDRQRIALALLRSGARLVGICADRVYPSPAGIELGAGALTAMLAYAADVQPIFCGKPERIFFEELCGHLGVQPNRCVLIGDNLEADIAGGNAMGMTTLLTLTGVTHRAHLERLHPHRTPTAVIDSLEMLL